MVEKKRELISKTLSQDYPGLDYLGFSNVLNAKKSWYRVLWFTIVITCLFIGLYTIYRILREYADTPTATLISVKSVEKLLLPQLTVCPTHPASINTEKVEEHLFKKLQKNYTKNDVVNFGYFMLAGSGFQFFDIFGLQCREFFYDCHLGDTILDCCNPEYTIRRGRCFRTRPLYQRSFDELGKLRVTIRKPYEMDANNPNGELIAFLDEHKPHIAPFPRYYLYPYSWTKLRITAKHISLFPADEVCSEEVGNLSKDTCYIQEWLINSLERPFNCRYPYMDQIRKTDLERFHAVKLNILNFSCHPSLIIDNYNTTVEAPSYTRHSCILACNRWEYTVSIDRTDLIHNNKTKKENSPVYRVDVSYNDLQYESIEEVTTVTFAGLIAQIGGQMSLFMGSSILNLIQFFIMSIILLKKSWKRKQQRVHQQNNINNHQSPNLHIKNSINSNTQL